MLELLVIAMCAKGLECSQLTSAYMAQNSPTAQTVKQTTAQVKRKVGKETVFTIGLFYTGLVKQSIKLRLPANFTLQGSNDNVLLNYRYDF